MEALFSVGDAHGVQGDGEVCVSAVEMDSTTSLRFFRAPTFQSNEPQLRCPDRRPQSAGATTGARHTRRT